MIINNTKDLRDVIRDGKYAFPGGYPKFFTTSDGGVLSFDSVLTEYRNIIHAMRNDDDDGWRVVAADINWEDTGLYCDHTNELIESAYG